MSAIRHETTSAAHTNRQSAIGILRAVAVKCGGLLLKASNAYAEARMHRAMIEAELYRNLYRHASKNDDELPIDVQAAPGPQITWCRFADAAVTIAKRAYPAIVVLSLLATALAATFAIRLAIWLPGHLN
jgi:hypothetical protein